MRHLTKPLAPYTDRQLFCRLENRMNREALELMRHLTKPHAPYTDRQLFCRLEIDGSRLHYISSIDTGYCIDAPDLIPYGATTPYVSDSAMNVYAKGFTLRNNGD